MKNKNILFRADSSSKIGLGHIMRNLVLAKQFNDNNIIFASLELEGNIMDKIPYSVVVLPNPDISELIKVVKQKKIDMLVIDHYDIRYEDEKIIKEQTGVKLFVLDDTYKKHYCDILLNHNIYADKSRYKGLVPSFCELRCGSKYTLIRDEFVKEKEKKTIFLAMGGTDHSNINIPILEVVRSFENIEVHIITTMANQNLDKLRLYSKDKDWIKLHINSNKIAHLIKRSDFAIVSPSVILHEVMFMELPFIAIKSANNQNEMYKYLCKNHDNVLDQFNVDTLKIKIKSFISAIELVNFIDLSLEEKKMVLKWRNHKNIRKWMFQQSKISLKEHLSYIDFLKVSDDRLYFLVKRKKEAIGVVDFTNIKNRSTEFGIYANPKLQGVGDILMEAVKEYAFDILKVKTLIAQVFVENLSAKKLYKKHNFKKIKKQDIIIRMELRYEDW